jgi:hypothetical protein
LFLPELIEDGGILDLVIAGEEQDLADDLGGAGGQLPHGSDASFVAALVLEFLEPGFGLFALQHGPARPFCSEQVVAAAPEAE